MVRLLSRRRIRNLRNLRHMRSRLRRRPQEGEDGYDDDIDVDFLNKLIEESEKERKNGKKERQTEGDVVEYWKRVDDEGNSMEVPPEDVVDVNPPSALEETSRSGQLLAPEVLLFCVEETGAWHRSLTATITNS